MTNFIEIPASKKSISFRKPVFGVGINDADYMVCPRINRKMLTCPHYKVWVNMLNRCYSDKYQDKRPTYKGCSTCEEWLIFSKFKYWMVKQDWQGKCLDKDLLFQGNKIYSPETCVFVTIAINSLLTDCKATRGLWPQGVGFHKRVKKFHASIRINGKLKHIGYFDSKKEAHEAYKKEKYALIKEVALKQIEPLRSALLSYVIK